MVKTGVLTGDDRVELLYGEIVEMSPIGSKHSAVLNRLARHFFPLSPKRATVSTQSSLEVSDHSEPQPDLLLLKPRQDDYYHELPKVEDVLLLIEVADSSLVRDKRVKLPLYAAEGVREFWLVDLEAKAVEIHKHPSGDGYRDVRRCQGQDVVAPEAFADHTLVVGTLFA